MDKTEHKQGRDPAPLQDDQWTAKRIEDLRNELARQDLDGFIVPRVDEHQGEYVPPSAERLAWISGFTGSAGTAVILRDRATLFTDGRYTLQAETETDKSIFTLKHLIDEPVADWLAENLEPSFRLGYDAWLMTPNQQTNLKKSCAKAGAELIPTRKNPIDNIWTDQPTSPLNPAYAYDQTLAGRTHDEKRAAVAEDLIKENLDAVVLSAPDSINWLLNIRGSDVPFTPFALCFAILFADGSVELFLDLEKRDRSLTKHLGSSIVVMDPVHLGDSLDRLGEHNKSIGFDADGTPVWIVHRLKNKGATVKTIGDPCQKPKAIKNTEELNGIRQAHLRDGKALTSFLAWLDDESKKGNVTEISAADRLERFRRESEKFRDLSFPTISGSGPNGAIVHYRVTSETDRHLKPGNLYLVDSGAQYVDGTTDVTRTLVIGGNPPEEAKRHFTLVLKGHIALSSCLFPEGTTGSQLDILARHALWQEGLDYDHGTGHGVGCFLSVHEGPQRISKMPSRIALEPGMILSNEPGYYKADNYGIRIENLVQVVEKETPSEGERKMLGFEPLTLAPIDQRLINTGLLNDKEKNWVNSYHQQVRKTLAPLLDDKTVKWLNQATAHLN